MLEQQVVLVRNTTDASKDIATHEVVSIRAKPVDDLRRISFGSEEMESPTDIMVIPDVQLRNLAVGCRKGLGVVPTQVVLEVVVVAFRAQLLRERKVPALLRVLDIGPRPQRAGYSDAIVVDLVSAPNHDVVGPLFMFSNNIVPEGSTAPSVLIGANTESIARMEHDAH